MFFKKKEKVKDQFDVYYERRAPRFASKAGITIKGFEGEGRVRNVGIYGCCMESVTYVALVPDEEYLVQIIPEKESNMESFTVKFILNWTKSSENIYEAGFDYTDKQLNAKLTQYVETLRSRGIEPDYGSTDRPKN